MQTTDVTGTQVFPETETSYTGTQEIRTDGPHENPASSPGSVVIHSSGPRVPQWGWVVAVVAALVATVVIVALIVLHNNEETVSAQSPVPAQSAAPGQDPAPAQSAAPASGGETSSESLPVAEPTAAPAEDVEAVPTSSSDVVIENATVDANGTVTVYGYAVESGLTQEQIEALITYAGEVIAVLPVATDGSDFAVQWKPGTLSGQVNLRDLGANGVAAELGKYQMSVMDNRHPGTPASVGFKPKSGSSLSRPDGSGPNVEVPSVPGGGVPSRPGGGARR